MSIFSSPLRAALVAGALVLTACSQTGTPAKAQDLGLFASPEPVSAIQLPPVPSKRFSEEDPATILVIGDSLGQGIGLFLRERTSEMGLHARIVNVARSSTGLSRKDYYDWPEAFARFAEAERPDIVVAHFGANDMQSVIRPTERIRFGTEAWDEAYREEIREILKVADTHDAMLYWLGPGPDRNSALNTHLAHVNPLYASEADASGAIYLPISEFAATPEGGFLQRVALDGRNVTIRTGDGSHFTGLGYTMIVDRLLVEIKRRAPSIFGPGEDLLAALQ